MISFCHDETTEYRLYFRYQLVIEMKFKYAMVELAYIQKDGVCRRIR
jgi:hypothetical protein